MTDLNIDDTSRQWQPIATVPEELWFVIAAWPSDPDGYLPYEVGEATRDGADKPWVCAVTNARIEPTHWQMLPYPPTS